MAHRGRTATRVPAFVAIVTVLVAWTQLCAAQTTTGTLLLLHQTHCLTAVVCQPECAAEAAKTPLEDPLSPLHTMCAAALSPRA